jgi:hypothetical protein
MSPGLLRACRAAVKRCFLTWEKSIQAVRARTAWRWRFRGGWKNFPTWHSRTRLGWKAGEGVLIRRSNELPRRWRSKRQRDLRFSRGSGCAALVGESLSNTVRPGAGLLHRSASCDALATKWSFTLLPPFVHPHRIPILKACCRAS